MTGPLFLAVEPDEETKSLVAQMLARAYGDEWPLPVRRRLPTTGTSPIGSSPQSTISHSIACWQA